jgi:transposase-like protein
MSKKRFSTEVRARAVDEYTSGLKSAQELSEELGTTPQSIYRWKTVYTERQKDIRLDEIISDGNTREQAKKYNNLSYKLKPIKSSLPSKC